MDCTKSSNLIASVPNKNLKNLALMFEFAELWELLLPYSHIEMFYLGFNPIDQVEPEIAMESFTLENLKSRSDIRTYFFPAVTMPNLSWLDIVRCAELHRFALDFRLRILKNLTHFGTEQAQNTEKFLKMLKNYMAQRWHGFVRQLLRVVHFWHMLSSAKLKALKS